MNQRTSFILSLMLCGGEVRQGSLARPPSTAVTNLFSAEKRKIRSEALYFIRGKLVSDSLQERGLLNIVYLHFSILQRLL